MAVRSLMNRREFISTALLAAPAVAWAGRASAAWRWFEIATLVDIAAQPGQTQVWVPAPVPNALQYQRPLRTRFSSSSRHTTLVHDAHQQIACVHGRFAAGRAISVNVVSQVAVRDWSVDLGDSQHVGSMSDRGEFLRPTRYVPTDGIVRERALAITEGASTDVQKARAIYEWVVENTRRNPHTRGCGRGDIRYMLESGDLSGKCADLNALFVGLARAAGLPARDAYGIRVAASRGPFDCLGAKSSDVTSSQHCRAEVYLHSRGWVPVDPADVRKVMLEEPAGSDRDAQTNANMARQRLFGSWEMNWIAYNFAQDVRLPGSSLQPLPFFMYPQAETDGGRLDALDPASFRYRITAREVAPART